MRPVVCGLVLVLVGCGKKAEPTAPKGDTLPVAVVPKEKERPKGDTPPKGKEPPKVAGATPFPPDDWTHKELVEFLGTKGIAVHVRALPGSPGRTVAALKPYEDKAEVLVSLCADAKDAREQAGVLGGKSFSRGRFAFGNRPFPGANEDLKRFDYWIASEELLQKIAAVTR